MSLAALIFDLDGTLAETEEAHRTAFNAAFAARGMAWHWTPEVYRALLATTGGKERIAAHAACIGEVLTPDAIAALHADKTARYGALIAAGELPLRPGVADLVAAARAAGLRLAVATTTSRPNVEALTQAAWGRPAAEVFDVIAAGDEVALKKPAPDVYLLALDRLGVAPGKALALEDSRNGLLSARAAGLRVLVTPSLYTDHEDHEGADWVVPSLAAAHLPEVLARLV
ncbi:MAG: HAD-IA family hydrolase [Rhodobacteraceae bacterium]|nr:HAD-IA family hydrolase [Paracoccaceae bacterium]